MNLYTYFRLKYLLKNYATFIWDSNDFIFKNISKFKSIPLNLLVAIDRQKKTLLENTRKFAEGNFTNNALLWGVRGNGKSSLIKAIFNELNNEFPSIKLIQLDKNSINDIYQIYSMLEKFNYYRFVIFIDDLSFDSFDIEYKIIKSKLDGGLYNQPTNIILYTTSNRRHLMPRDMIDNERSSAIHSDESVEEKVSLSDRFGLWIGFHNLLQEEYLNIIKSYFNFYNIELLENDLKKSIQWSLQRGNRTGRTAWQYVLQIASDRNLKIMY